MRCAIIFHCTRKRISKVEKKAYDSREDVFFHKNAWADSEFCMALAEKCFRNSLMHERGTVPAEQSLLTCLLYTSPSPRDGLLSRMPSSA